MSKTTRMSKTKPRPQRAKPHGEKSEFARKVDDAHQALAALMVQEMSIHDSIRDSREAIQESRTLLDGIEL